jgi:hypothetical protein
MSTDPERQGNGLAASPSKRVKDRSPNYPLIDLETALQKAAVIHRDLRTREVPIALIHQRWEVKPLSGAGNQLVAALKAYGLMDVTGQGDERKVGISAEGDRILRNAPDKKKLLQTAALRPAIHKELWDLYSGQGGIPADDVLTHYLVWERPEPRFNDKTVARFIARFRSTLRLAGLEASDIMDGAEDDDSHIPLATETTSDMPLSATAFQDEVEKTATGNTPFSASAVNAAVDRLLRGNEGMKDFPLYTATSRGALYVPSSMDTKDFALLKQQIAAYLTVIEATSVRPDPPADK